MFNKVLRGQRLKLAGQRLEFKGYEVRYEITVRKYFLNNFPCINAKASEIKRNRIKHVDRIEITAPVVVGCVKSFGN